MNMSEISRLETGSDFELTPRTRIFFRAEGLPEKAGKAELQFWKGLTLPERDKELIKFPSRQGELVYHSLRGGHQFLVEVGERAYFGGTDELDESVFLAEVTEEALQAFAEHGDFGFYESLKPNELKQLEAEHSQGETRRQGDIFAFWCPAFGRNVNELMGRELRKRGGMAQLCFNMDNRSKIVVLNTRHEIMGGRQIAVSWREEKGGQETYFTGQLCAPDHQPLSLGCRPHRLLQAANIVRPRPGCGDR